MKEQKPTAESEKAGKRKTNRARRIVFAFRLSGFPLFFE
jgi:hypothetical protein